MASLSNASSPVAASQEDQIFPTSLCQYEAEVTSGSERPFFPCQKDNAS